MHTFILCLVISSVLCKVDPDSVTVSGLSSGGYMATQLHFAHSALLKGAAIFAAGPYYCSQNDLNISLKMCRDSLEFVPVAPLIAYAKNQEANGLIDPLVKLRSQPVYIFVGTMDTTVNPKVVKSLETMYRELGVTNILTKYDLEAAHTFPADFGNDCLVAASPFISKCPYQGAGHALTHLYGSLAPPKTSSNTNILEFSQAQFVPSGSSPHSISMNALGYAYIPTACKTNSNTNLTLDCRLHVAFHGCRQVTSMIGRTYVEKTGLNDWAESNNIIVVYPQAKETPDINTFGCWDWWGYTNDNYANKNGLQIQTVYNMIQHFLYNY